jgi:hypothetical protein
MTHVRFWNEGSDLKAEYFYLKSHQPAEARAIRDAIADVVKDPDLAGRRYSTRLDRAAGWLATPFLAPGGLTCLIWRHSPDGDDAIEVVDFSQPWDDVDMPPVWPRPDP